MIELTEYIWPAKVMRYGMASGVVVSAGQHLKIETSPGGEEILDEQVPDRKQWSVRIIVEIEEEDV